MKHILACGMQLKEYLEGKLQQLMVRLRKKKVLNSVTQASTLTGEKKKKNKASKRKEINDKSIKLKFKKIKETKSCFGKIKKIHKTLDRQSKGEIRHKLLKSGMKQGILLLILQAL